MNRFLVAAACLLLFTTACREPVVRGKGDDVTEQRTVNAYFNKIAIDGPVDATIEVNPNTAASVSLTGYANILPYLITKIEDSTLHLSVKDGVHLYMKRGMKAHIVVPSLAKLGGSGSSDVVVNGTVNGPEFELEKSGSGDVTFNNITVANLSVDVAGSSDVLINGGTTTKATYSIEGSGGINAFGLQTAETSIDIAGSGDAEVSASSKLDVSIAGSGDIGYKGHPVVTKSVVGSGDLTDAN